MNTKKNKRLLALFSLINIMFLGVYGYLFYVVASKNTETVVLYTTSHQQASDKEKIQELDRTIKDTEKERNNLSAYFVTKTSAVTFIEQIEKIGKNAGVDLSVNSVSGDAKGGGTTQLAFSAAGTFSDIYRLIALVESMPYKVTLKKADMQVTSDQKDGSTIWKGGFVVTLESFVATSAATSTAGVVSGMSKK